MRDWNETSDRIAATWDFCERLRRAPDEKEKCIADGKHARAYFAEGWFDLAENPNADPERAIPEDIEFRVFNYKPIPKRDKLVVLVIPPDEAPLPLLARPTEPVEDVWRCTWPSYLTLRSGKS